LVLKLEDINPFIELEHLFIGVFGVLLLLEELLSQLLKVHVVSVLGLVDFFGQFSQFSLLGEFGHDQVVEHLFDFVSLVQVVLVKTSTFFVELVVLGFQILDSGYQGI